MGKRKNKKNSNTKHEQVKNEETQAQSWLTPANIVMLSVGMAAFAIASSSMMSYRTEETSKPFTPPIPPKKGLDYFQYASSLPEKECTELVDGIMSPSNFGSDFMDDMIDVATGDDKKLSQSLKQGLEYQDDRLTDENKQMVMTCLASSPEIEVIKDKEILKMLDADAIYSSSKHIIGLKDNPNSQGVVHEIEHCAQSTMATAYVKPPIMQDDRPLATPYPGIEPQRSEQLQQFGQSFVKFASRLKAVASDIQSGVKSERAEEMLKLYEEAYPAEDDIKNIKITLSIPPSLPADHSFFKSQLGKDKSGKDKVYTPPKGTDIDPNLYYSGMLPQDDSRKFNLKGIDKENNALIFKPLDTDARFMLVYKELNNVLNTHYVMDNMRRSMPLIDDKGVQDVRNAEIYTNTMDNFGHPKFIERYGPELQKFSAKTQKSFAERVCSEGYPTKKGTHGFRSMA